VIVRGLLADPKDGRTADTAQRSARASIEEPDWQAKIITKSAIRFGYEDDGLLLNVTQLVVDA
jgi:hypothetical protein